MLMVIASLILFYVVNESTERRTTKVGALSEALNCIDFNFRGHELPNFDPNINPQGLGGG